MAKVEKVEVNTPPKTKYKLKNWPAYNAGLKKRGSLTLWLDEKALGSWQYAGEKQRGGQYEYSDVCIITLLCLKATFRLAFRQLEGFVESLFELSGISLPVPCYSQICRRQRGLEVPLWVEKHLLAGKSVHMVVDSSGLKVYGEGEWKVRKHGWSKRRTWRKIHLGVDEKSGQVIAQVLTDNKTDDASVVPDLLSQSEEGGILVDKFGSDGAYDTYDTWDLLSDLDIQAIIPPRDNAVFKVDKDGALCEHPRNAVLEQIVDKDLKTWKIESGYHRRSLSETTFFRWKITLGDKLWARRDDTQKTEAAVKSAVLNKFIQAAKPLSFKIA